jgi:hypothetical protein
MRESVSSDTLTNIKRLKVSSRPILREPCGMVQRWTYRLFISPRQVTSSSLDVDIATAGTNIRNEMIASYQIWRRNVVPGHLNIKKLSSRLTDEGMLVAGLPSDFNIDRSIPTRPTIQLEGLGLLFFPNTNARMSSRQL